MNKLEELLLQKKEIEARIKELQDPTFAMCRSVRIAKKSGTEDGRDWVVSTLMKQTHVKYESKKAAEMAGRDYWNREIIEQREIDRWQSFIREKSKKDAIERIRSIIGDLNELLFELEEKED